MQTDEGRSKNFETSLTALRSSGAPRMPGPPAEFVPSARLSNAGVARSLCRSGDVQAYGLCEELTECLIFLMVIFGPWAFGTTERWSVWTMNAACYALGVLFLIKMVKRNWGG